MALFNITIERVIAKCDDSKLNLIIQKLIQMGVQLDEIKAALAESNAKVDRVAADVQRLHDIINNAGETPTQAEWDEVKATIASLNNKLQGVDDQTPE